MAGSSRWRPLLSSSRKRRISRLSLERQAKSDLDRSGFEHIVDQEEAKWQTL